MARDFVGDRKPRHSESNGGGERRNRTVDEKIRNWMHENQSTHWAQSLPFMQWHCNIQIHRGIGGQTPYHLMFGQHPQAGISNLPIAPNLLYTLATEIDVNQCFGLPLDIPLEQSTFVAYLELTVPSTVPQNRQVRMYKGKLNIKNSQRNCTQRYQQSTPEKQGNCMKLSFRRLHF